MTRNGLRPPAFALPSLSELWPGGGDGALRRFLVGRSLPLRPRHDQARLQLAEERGIVCQRLCDLGGDAPLRGGFVGDFLKPIRDPVDELVGFRHFLAGGSSPVATRQTFEAVRRATIVAAAARAP